MASPNGVHGIGYEARDNMLTEARPGSVAVRVGYDGYGSLTSYAKSASFANSCNGLDDRVAVATTTGSTTDVRRFWYDADGLPMGEHGASPVKAETSWLSPKVEGEDRQCRKVIGRDGTLDQTEEVRLDNSQASGVACPGFEPTTA